jgi:hypothetical protein
MKLSVWRFSINRGLKTMKLINFENCFRNICFVDIDRVVARGN